MSAKAAAEALLRHDADLADFGASVRMAGLEKGELVRAYVREHIYGTWTLALAADAAQCTEEQVIAALLHLDPLKYGTTAVCRIHAAEMCGGEVAAAVAPWRRSGL